MKKIITLAITALITLSSQAQFAVDSTGLVNIHNPGSKPAYVNIEGNKFNLRALRTGTATLQSPAMEAQNQMSGNFWLFGFKGLSYGTGNSYNCGVFGLSTEGGSHKNFGVMGCLNSTSHKGAGIYGTTRWSQDPVTAFSKGYAGYFDGDVHIQGNVTYSGSLTGNVMLTSQPDVSALSSTTSTTENRTQETLTSDLLQGISMKTYYHTPQQDESKGNRQMDYTGLDSTEIAILQNNISEDTTEDVISRQILSKKHYALDTEELEEAFPDLVYENEDGTKSINYVEMVPILVQSIKELSAKIEELEEGSVTKKKAARAASTSGISNNLVMLSLGQNKPNPFGTITSIDVSIPDDVKKAFIYIYDLQGKKVDEVDITARGRQTIRLNAATLSDGMYLYSLIADGKVVETRRMIVEKHN